MHRNPLSQDDGDRKTPLGEEPRPPEQDAHTQVGDDTDGLKSRTMEADDELGLSAITFVGPSSSPAAETIPIDRLPMVFGDYELLSEIARGGMGITYRARQISLNRLVALKMIKSGLFADSQEIQRFHAEAATAASLDHPNIVPVYQVGQIAGHHYFSMGLVEGTTLEQVLRAGPLTPRAAARLALTVTDAVAYAHTHDIIHRDLKPGNILLAEATPESRDDRELDLAGVSVSVDEPPVGTPRITDFGLAKRLSCDSDLTVTGQVLGTPAYMPPEQAEGRSDAIDARSDVYSIGAVLYHMMCGRPPFLAAGTMKTLRQVIDSDPVPPRQLNSTIDVDLETICLKCLAKEPQRRYASADALADDLRCYLEHRPIQARPLGWGARFGRWCRRRPALAATSIALVVALLLGSTVSTFFAVQSRWNAEFYRQEKVRADNEAARAMRALTNEREAHAKLRASMAQTEQTIQRWVDATSQTELLQEPRFKPVLKKMLKEARDHYTAFVKQHEAEGDTASRVRLANAFYQIGQINRTSGSLEEALQAYEQALMLYRQANAGPHGDANLDLQRTLVEYYHAVVLNELGKPARAMDAFQTVIGHFEELVGRSPHDRAIRGRLAEVLRACARVMAKNSAADQALAMRLRAYEIIVALRDAEPRNDEYAMTFATTCHDLGISYAEAARMDEAIKRFAQARDVLLQLVGRNPANAEYANKLAGLYDSIGVAFFQVGQCDNARANFQRRRDICQQLVRRHPTVTSYQYELARSYDRLGCVAAQLGNADAAVDAFDKTRELLVQLTAEYPSTLSFQCDLAGAYYNLSTLYDETARPRKALDTLRKAVVIQRHLTAQNPGTTGYWIDLARSLSSVGIISNELNQPDEALSAYREAIQISERLVHANPETARFQIELAGMCVNMTTVAGGAPAVNRSYLDRAIGLLTALRRHDPSNAIACEYLRKAYFQRAELAEQAANFQQAAADWQLATDLASGWERTALAGRELHARWRAHDPRRRRRAGAVIWTEFVRWLAAICESNQPGPSTPSPAQ